MPDMHRATDAAALADAPNDFRRAVQLVARGVGAYATVFRAASS
jgi:hypothetical protein